MSKADIITRRIMSCISPEDPKVDKVLTNHEDLELAMFMSKTLVASIMSFTTREKRNKEIEERKRLALPMEVDSRRYFYNFVINYFSCRKAEISR
jgi:hypothetical protein